MKRWETHPHQAIDQFNKKIDHFSKSELVGSWCVFFTGMRIGEGARLTGHWVGARAVDNIGNSVRHEVVVNVIFGRWLYPEDLIIRDCSNEAMHKVQQGHERLLQIMKETDAAD